MLNTGKNERHAQNAAGIFLNPRKDEKTNVKSAQCL
jgi:hypothetical protein